MEGECANERIVFPEHLPSIRRWQGLHKHRVRRSCDMPSACRWLMDVEGFFETVLLDLLFVFVTIEGWCYEGRYFCILFTPV